MYILAIETTGAFASTALLQDGRIIGKIYGNDRFSHLQNLMPQIEEVVKSNGLSLGDINAIAVSNGPGSFTGIRIGVSTARALSQVLGIPCVPVSSLEALAMRAAEYEACSESGGSAAETMASVSSFDMLICPILDARRSQVYGGGYFLKAGFPEEKIKAGAYTIEEFLAETAPYEKILLLGDGSDTCSEKIRKLRPAGTWTAPESIRYQTAVSVARLGERLLHEKGGLTYCEVMPEYMRLAEAERKLKEKQQE